MAFQVNCLPEDDLHEISCLVRFLKAGTKFKNIVCCNFFVALRVMRILLYNRLLT